MSSKFSCSLRYSDALKVKNTLLVYSDAFDEYKVKYRSNVCRDLILSIEWTVPKQVLVTVKLYSKKFRKCFSSKGNVVDGCKTFMKLRGGFNICSSPDYNILCLINVTPFVHFKECTEKCAGSENTLEKVNSLSPVGKLLDMNDKIDDREEKHAETIQTNDFKKPDIISEMLRNELITNGTRHDGDVDAFETQIHGYKEETKEVFANTNSSAQLESEETQHQPLSLDNTNGTETKNDIDEANAVNSVVKSDPPLIVEEQELSEKHNHAQCIEDFDMAIIEDLNVEKAIEQTDTPMNPSMLDTPDKSSNNQDSSFCVSNVCKDSEIDSSSSLISNDVTLNTVTALDVKSVETSLDENNFAEDKTMDITDIELNTASKKTDEPAESKAQDSSTNECTSQSDYVDCSVSDNMETNDTSYEEIDLTKENEPLELPVDKEIVLIDVDGEIKSEMEIDYEINLPLDKSYENTETMVISSSGDVSISLSDLESSVECNEESNTNKLMVSGDSLNKSDSGIDLDVEDKYVSNQNADSFKVDNVIPKERRSRISSETKLETKLKTQLQSKHKMFTENEEINNTHLNDNQLIEQNGDITNKTSVSDFQPQCSSVDDCKTVTFGVTANSTTNTVNTYPHAVSNFFTDKANLVSETLIKKCSTPTSRSIPVKSSGTAKRGAITKLWESPQRADVCKQTFPVMETRMKGLSMNMLDLLMSGHMSDAVISNGKREVKVHKAIMSARSSVFKNIFSELAKGSVESKVNVSIPSYILEDVVVFLYAGLVNIKSKKMAHDLRKVAKLYCIKDLIDICSKYISN